MGAGRDCPPKRCAWGDSNLPDSNILIGTPVSRSQFKVFPSGSLTQFLDPPHIIMISATCVDLMNYGYFCRLCPNTIYILVYGPSLHITKKIRNFHCICPTPKLYTDLRLCLKECTEHI